MWDELLPTLIMCYNDSYHSAIGCRPSEVLFGRLLARKQVKTDLPKSEYTELGFVQRLQYILAKTHQLVFEKVQEKKLRNTIGKSKTVTSFDIGDEVMLYCPAILTGESRKLTSHWFGPYKVSSVGRSGKVYYLLDHLGDPFKYPISVHLLKKYVRRIGDESFSQMPEDLQKTNKDFDKDKDDLTSPIALMQRLDPSDSFVPTNVLPDGTSEEVLEERVVLESLKTPLVEVTKQSSRPTKKPKRFAIAQTTYVNGKKRKTRY